MNTEKALSIVEKLQRLVEQKPNEPGFRFFKNDIQNPLTFTYQEFWDRAVLLAIDFEKKQLKGERVIIAPVENHHFAIAFFACLMSGAIAVPAPPLKHKNKSQRLTLMIEDAQAKAIVSDRNAEKMASESICKYTSEDLDNEITSKQLQTARAWHLLSIDPDALAFLQYTSGSTSAPKGVMISHGNIMANLAVISNAMELTERDELLSILPMFHDMGLIAGLLEPIFLGVEARFLPPVKYVQNPELWIGIISHWRISASGGPNSMYALAEKYVTDQQMVNLDISCWKMAYCGAEPVRLSTVTKFFEKFAAIGFKEENFTPCYGMAESTLFISCPAARDGLNISKDIALKPLVGCGYARLDMTIKIVNPETKIAVPEGQEGEIWVSGTSIGQGYWRNAEKTSEAFAAHLADTNEGPYLRTGDLGVFKDNQLYFTGRIKDIIIINGHNFAPQDLELTAEESHPSIQFSACAVFSVDRDDQEIVIAAAEIDRANVRKKEEHAKIKRAMADAIYSTYKLHLSEVILLLPHSIPRTSSGKIRRAQCRQDYLDNRLKAL